MLYVAEPVGKPGLFTLRHTIGDLQKEFKPDFVWGGGDGATGGFGLGKNHAFSLHKMGLQAVTLGECAYYKKDLHPVLPTMNFVLRPANFPEAAPGPGGTGSIRVPPAGSLSLPFLVKAATPEPIYPAR